MKWLDEAKAAKASTGRQPNLPAPPSSLEQKFTEMVTGTNLSRVT